MRSTVNAAVKSTYKLNISSLAIHKESPIILIQGEEIYLWKPHPKQSTVLIKASGRMKALSPRIHLHGGQMAVSMTYIFTFLFITPLYMALLGRVCRHKPNFVQLQLDTDSGCLPEKPSLVWKLLIPWGYDKFILFHGTSMAEEVPGAGHTQCWLCDVSLCAHFIKRDASVCCLLLSIARKYSGISHIVIL